MISKAILINSKLEGRKNTEDKLSLFIRSGPCLKIPRRSVNRKPLNRHLFLVSSIHRFQDSTTRILLIYNCSSLIT